MILVSRYLSRLKRFRLQSRTRLLKRMPREATCAEIGVWKGDFSQQILEQTRPKELYLIDPWIFRPELPDHWYGGAAAINQADMDRIFQSIVDRFAHRRDVRIHRAPSSELPEILGNRQLDWVYIDGDTVKRPFGPISRLAGKSCVPAAGYPETITSGLTNVEALPCRRP